MSEKHAAPEDDVRLDPMTAMALERLGDTPYVDLDSLPIDEALNRARPAFPVPPPPAGTQDRWVATSDGASVRVRLYGSNEADTPRPAVLHLHGGGFVSGSIELDDARCAWLAREAGCVIASVDYRLAPEHPFPAAAEDAFAAWQWLLSEAPTFGADARRCAVSGSSAGGHVAINVIQLALTRGVQPPAFQLLAYPVVDPKLSTESYARFGQGPFLTRARMAWYWKQYGGEDRENLQDLWDPTGTDVANFPEAHITTAEYDVLRDEGEDYGMRLRAAGIRASIERRPGMIHGFVTMTPDHPEAVSTLVSGANALRRVFGTHGPA